MKTVGNGFYRLVIGATTIVMSLVACGGYGAMRSLMLQNLKENALLEVQQGVNNIDQWLIARKTEVETLASTPTIQTMNWALVEPYLKQEITSSGNIVAFSDVFFIFAMVEADGSFYNTKVGRSAKNASHREYFKRAMAGQTTVSDPFIGLETDIPTIAIAAPILSPTTAEPMGDINGNVKLDRLTQVVNQLNYGEGSYAFVLNSKGGAIAHPNRDLLFNVDRPTSPILLNHADPDLATIAKHMVNREQGINLHAIDGKRQYVAYLPLTAADWSVALVIPRQNIERQLLPLNAIALTVVGLTLAMITLLWKVQTFEQRQLKKTKNAAEAANQAKSEFLANISHELRTPLNSILGYAQILRREKNITPKQQKGLDIISQSGEHLLALINDVLDIAKIEARKLTVQPQPTHLLSLLTGVVDIIRVRALQKGLQFYYYPGEPLPQYILVDERRLRQILLNLLGNAVKFTQEGSVTLKVDSVSFMQMRSEQSCRLSFEIKDTGVGISTREISRIFQPFEQGEKLYNKLEGTGLGLAISQQIVKLMGSQLQVRSRLKEGSTFSFSLNVEIPPLESLSTLQSLDFKSASAVIGYKGERKTILIVDDRWENRSVMAGLLEPLGFVLIQAEDGQIGLEKTLCHQPNLIITDLVMPKLDGYAFLQKMRQKGQQSDSIKRIPVIVSSASVSKSDRQASLNAGASDFLPKPICTSELLMLLRKYLKIKWQYEDKSEPALARRTSPLKYALNHEQPTEEAQLTLPPPDEIAPLHHAASMGNITQVEYEAHRLTDLNASYQAFAEKLLNFAQAMDDEAILTLVETCYSAQKTPYTQRIS
ncbi:MAG: ATP-binding protein [Cyanobacteria bacterium J06560_5]